MFGRSKLKARIAFLEGKLEGAERDISEIRKRYPAEWRAYLEDTGRYEFRTSAAIEEFRTIAVPAPMTYAKSGA